MSDIWIIIDDRERVNLMTRDVYSVSDPTTSRDGTNWTLSYFYEDDKGEDGESSYVLKSCKSEKQIIKALATLDKMTGAVRL